MTRGLLKSTTMLALAASLAMPMAAQSQEAKADCAQTPDAKACLDKDPKAKGKEAGETAGEKKGKVAATAGASAETPAAEADLKAGIEAEAEADGALEAPEAQAGTGAPTESAPAEKAPAAAAQAEAAPEKAETTTEQQAEAPAPKAQAEAKSAEEAPAPDAAQAQASEPGAAPAAEAEAKSAETKGSDELKKALEAEQAAQGDATPAPKAASGAEVTADTASEPASAEGSGELKKALEAGQSAEADATATPKATAETDTTAEADAQPAGTEGSNDLKKALEAEQAAQGTATEKPDAPEMEATAADAAPKAPTAEADAEQQAAAPDAEAKPRTAEAEPEAPSAEQQAEAVAREEQQSQSAAAAAAASSEEAPEDAELVEESLTEADVRASDEDFATDLRTQAENEQQAETSAKAKKDDDDEDGLSNFEKAALVGLGTFALSQILDDGAQVVQNTGDRVVVEQDGQYRVLRNDDVLLRQPGSDVKTYRYNDGSTRTVVAYDDGTSVETIKTADGRVLRRARILPDGQQVVLFDDTQSAQQVVVSELPQARTQRLNFRDLQGEDLAAALASQEAEGVDRAFSLNQIRNIDRVRHLVPEISVDTVTFQTNSAAIRPGEAEELAALGNAMKRMIEENPSEVFLIEGHTDATGPASYNLALSDRRAESVALALTEYFDVPAANMVLQGYGESDLAVQSAGDERENRRAAVRRITPLLQGS